MCHTQKNVSDLLEPALQMAVNCHVGAKYQTQVLCSSRTVGAPNSRAIFLALAEGFLSFYQDQRQRDTQAAVWHEWVPWGQEQ